MANVVEAFPPPRERPKAKYPIDEWLDGQIRECWSPATISR